MSLISFARPTKDGWRYSTGHRTRKEPGGWRIEHWNGSEWAYIGHASSYANARELLI